MLIQRRHILPLLGGSLIAHPLTIQAADKIPVVGVLWHAGNAEEEAPFLGPQRQGFTDLGYIAGKNIKFEDRYANEQPELFDSLAAELVRLKVDVLVANNVPGILALQRATSTIPIVFINNPDPVGFKLVASLARPGGNITGVSAMGVDLAAKRVQLFKEAIPGLSRLAMLLMPTTGFDRTVSESQLAAAQLRISVETVEVREPGDLDRAFSDIVQRGFDGVMVTQHPMLFNERRKIAALALAKRLPTVGPSNVFAEAGVLMSYGANWTAMQRDTASYVRRILQGEKPADMPVQQPTKFELITNMKTAKALGLTIPPSILARADEVIE